jgi:hypothetical protein
MVALFLGYDVIILPKKADRAILGQKGQKSQNFDEHLPKLIAPIDSAWSITLEITQTFKTPTFVAPRAISLYGILGCPQIRVGV